MNIAINVQTTSFVYICVLGILLGVVYDFFSVFRTIFKHKVFTFFSDILFCAVSVCSFAFLSLKYGYGMMRAYLFFGVVLGFVLYFLAFDGLIYNMTMKICKNISYYIKNAK